MSHAIIKITDVPGTDGVTVECGVEGGQLNPKMPSHAIARYIGEHLADIAVATKQARAAGELSAPGTIEPLPPGVDPLLGPANNG